MEGLIQVLVILSCVAGPLSLILTIGVIYGIGIGRIAIPGVIDKATDGRKGVGSFARKSIEILAGIISLIGGGFGFLGFLLPWLRVDVGASSELLNLGSFGGSMNGIAIAFQAGSGGAGLLSSGFEGAYGLGFTLLLISGFSWIIALLLGLATLTGVGLFTIQIGLMKDSRRLVPKVLLVIIALSLCSTCAFFSGVQATIGGIQMGGSEEIFGTTLSLGAQVANGFWITVGGLLIALVGAIAYSNIAPKIESWAEQITKS